MGQLGFSKDQPEGCIGGGRRLREERRKSWRLLQPRAKPGRISQGRWERPRTVDLNGLLLFGACNVFLLQMTFGLNNVPNVAQILFYFYYYLLKIGLA